MAGFGIEDFLTDYTPADAATRAKMDRIRDLYADLARALGDLPVNPQRQAGFERLVEAKDCHVRCIIWGQREGV